MDEAIQVSCIIDKLPPSWKDFKKTLKHKKEELTLVELGSHLRIEGSLRVQDSNKPKRNNVVGPSVVNMVEYNNSSSTIRLLIAMASIHNHIIYQIDVKTAFLNGQLEEKVYMNQPQGFIMLGNENKGDWLLNVRHDLYKPGIAFVVGKLSKYTNTPSTRHWQLIQRVLKYLKKTMDYRLTYTGYPSVLEGYTDARWISNTKDNSSTSGWVFLLGGGVIFWASKKQTCITSSTIESEFMALAAAGKEAE
nr:zinc finger, CCHC-type [Tanacetum cinerariifolium]